MSKTKKSLLGGALISSLGIVLSKVIGILYAGPFVALVGDENMAFYSYAYRIYIYVLNISLAGIPFAVATLISKYSVLNKYNTIRYISKVAIFFLSVLGLFCTLIVFLFSKQIAIQISPVNVDDLYILKTTNVLKIISLALFFVPLLSCIRGIYQGFKDMQTYALSQVLEQFVRVFLLLGVGYILIYFFKLNRIYVVYFSVLSTSLAAIIALIHLKLKNNLVIAKGDDKVNKKSILKEMINVAFPFFVVTLLGYSYFIIDLLLFNKVMFLRGESQEFSSLVYGIINLPVDKLTSIPMAIAPGFSIAIIPFITASYTKNDQKELRKNILDAINASLYFAIPLAYVLFALSKEIYFVMYGSSSLELGAEILRWYSLDGLFSAISPVMLAIMMAISLRRLNIYITALSVFVKVILIAPLIYFLGYPGMLLSSVAAYLTSIALYLFFIKKVINIRWRYFINTLLKIVISLLGSQLLLFVFRFLIPFNFDSKLIALIQLMFIAISCGMVYLAISYIFKLPQRFIKIRLGGKKCV